MREKKQTIAMNNASVEMEMRSQSMNTTTCRMNDNYCRKSNRILTGKCVQVLKHRLSVRKKTSQF